MRRRSLLLRMLPPLLALGLLPWAAAGQRMMPGRWGVALHAGAPLGWRAGQARPLDWMAGVGVARYLQGYHQLQAEALYSRALYHAGALRAPVEDWVLQLGYSRMLWARWDRALLWHAAARASLAQMLAWQPEKIILAHGRCYERDAVAELKRAFRWLD